jgi:hypothetical protein
MAASAELPALEPGSSALLRRGLAEDRWHVTDYLRDGRYPAHRAEKDEAERYVACVLEAIAAGQLTTLLGEVEHYLPAMFPPQELAAAKREGGFERLVAFARLQRTLDEALWELEERSLDVPRREDPLFDGRRELFERLDRDGLLELSAAELADGRLAGEGVISYGDVALYPHPYLAPMRELVSELLALVGAEGLRVSVALHPYRVTSVEEVPMRLLEDYWSGIQVTASNLDSLDPHDVGVRSFHYADPKAAQRLFHPLLGTWFAWERRSRHDPSDPVKRLYVREVVPASNRRGEALVAALNRELHSERDTLARRFTHVDGKMCRYLAEDYPPSAQRPNADPGTPTQSRKLWRVDGSLSDALWQQLVGLHFRGNELIAEHFKDAFPAPA